MMMYGVALLSGCYLAGQILGELLGRWIGIDANVGGVGFAMILLILVNQWMHQKKWLTSEMEKGILFWGNLYIPVIVAMSAIQNVKGALSGGAIALIAGIIPTALCLLFIPVLSRFGKSGESEKKIES